MRRHLQCIVIISKTMCCVFLLLDCVTCVEVWLNFIGVCHMQLLIVFIAKPKSLTVNFKQESSAADASRPQRLLGDKHMLKAYS